MTPVAGQANTFDMVRADDPTQAGTPLNKATLMKDATAALFGLTAAAVPDDVLAWIGKYAQYWWQRRINKTTQTTNQNYSYYLIDEATDSSEAVTVYYASAYTVKDGKFVLTNPSSVSVYYDRATNANSLKGKYCITGAPSGNGMYQVPSSATVQTREKENAAGTKTYYSVWFNGCTYYYISNQIGDWEYVQSSNRNAYPDSGTSGGYEYEYLGIPFDNTLTAPPKIEIGSYAGTGSNGSSHKNTLTFSFVPYMVVILTNSAGTYYPGTVFVKGQTLSDGIGYNEHSASNYGLSVSWSGKTVSWYSSSTPSQQFNFGGDSYYYFAIGR